MRDELSPRQAAERIGTTTRTVQRWIVAGQLPARRVGGRWRVASVALDALARAETASAGRSGGKAEERPVRVLVVANRGEIAARSRRTADRLGITPCLPGSDGPAIDLLDGGAVIAAALSVGADAVHPGYGFLAEDAEFAAAVEQASIRWVGPPADAIRAMGDKAAARRLAARIGVPIVPGYQD